MLKCVKVKFGFVSCCKVCLGTLILLLLGEIIKMPGVNANRLAVQIDYILELILLCILNRIPK